MHQTVVELGGLRCLVVDDLPDGRAPTGVCVLCHGFGAPGSDLAPLGPELLWRVPPLCETLRFVFPAAPLSLDDIGMPGGRAWWVLDVEQLMAAAAGLVVRDLRRTVPEGLEPARERLMHLVEDVERTMHVPPDRVVLGGFSQGAMVATDMALRLPTGPAGLCVMSGTLLGEEAWRPLAKSHAPLPVLQSHGRQDPILPFAGAELLRDLLTEAGHAVEFLPFDGPHTIPPAVVERLGQRLLEWLPQ